MITLDQNTQINKIAEDIKMLRSFLKEKERLAVLNTLASDINKEISNIVSKDYPTYVKFDIK